SFNKMASDLKKSTVSIERLRNEIETRKRAERLMIIQRDFITALSTIHRLDDWPPVCLEAALNASEMDCGGIYLVNEESKGLDIIYHAGLSDAFVKSVSRYDADSTNVKLVKQGKTICGKYAELNLPLGKIGLNEGIETLAIIPIIYKGDVIGCFNIASHAAKDMPAFVRNAVEAISAETGQAVIRLKAEQDLREAEEKYRKQFEEAIDAIFLADVETGIMVDCNKSALELVGRERSEIIGQHQRILHPSQDTKKKSVTETFGRHIRDEEGRILETEVITKDAKIKNVEIKANIIEIKGRKILQGVFRDVTKRRKAEMALKDAYKQLRETQAQLIQAEKLEAVGRMASGIAHEVKNPLGIILQGINYLEDKSVADEQAREIIQLVKEGAKRANGIVRALLDFSRSGDLEMKPEDIKTVVERALNLVHHQLKMKDIKFFVESAEDLPKISIDKGKIEQVLINIYMNAIDSMSQGGSLYVRSYVSNLDRKGNKTGNRGTDTFRLDERVLIVEIEDNGCGMDEDIKSKIFDPFFTTKSRAEGTGLGLSVAKSIIEMHNGHIYVESEKGKGSKFTVMFKIS
ncbi:MAG: PAS domain S-box protein, partial [Candidatus Omnitrophica bacterium]|nr:PAS domain S-box protein [Candidatus Omnitrophota bacterium]